VFRVVETMVVSTKNGDSSVRAIDRAAAILGAFSVENPELSLTDLAKAANMAPSTTHRILASLVANRLIERNGDLRLYRLGSSAVSIGSAAMWNYRPAEVISEVLAELRDETHESIGLSRKTGNDALVVARAQSPLPLAANVRVGTLFPGHATSAGRVLLAGQTDEELIAHFSGARLEALTPSTPTSIEELLPLIQQARECGFATEHGQYATGLACIAVPVPVASGGPTMAIGISASAARWDLDGLETLAPRLQKAATKVAALNATGIE